MSSKMLRVTFDTNVCNILHQSEKRPDVLEPRDAQELRRRIAGGEIQAYFAEASLFVECLSFENKLSYLAAAGTRGERPEADPKAVARFKDLNELGIQVLPASLLGGEVFVEGLAYATDALYEWNERQNRFGNFVRKYPGRKPLSDFGNQLLAVQPRLPAPKVTQDGPGKTHRELRQDWAIGLKRHWDACSAADKAAFRKRVQNLIAEWGDTLILGAHYAHGNHLFCTSDEGKNAGSQSLLHLSNRLPLEAQGIVVVSPGELLNRLRVG